MDIKEQSLKSALEATACRELPKAYKEGMGFWIKAIVLVRKRNLTQSYALAERRADGVIRYTKDFGMMSQIAGIVSIHPYIYFDEKRFMPVYRNDEAQRRSLVSFFGAEREDEIMSADTDKLEILSREAGIILQLRNNPADIAADVLEQTAKENVIKSPAEGDEIMHTEEGPEEMRTIISATDYKGAKRTKKTKR